VASSASLPRVRLLLSFSPAQPSFAAGARRKANTGPPSPVTREDADTNAGAVTGEDREARPPTKTRRAAHGKPETPVSTPRRGYAPTPRSASMVGALTPQPQDRNAQATTHRGSRTPTPSMPHGGRAPPARRSPALLGGGQKQSLSKSPASTVSWGTGKFERALSRERAGLACAGLYPSSFPWFSNHFCGAAHVIIRPPTQTPSRAHSPVSSLRPPGPGSLGKPGRPPESRSR